MGPLAGLGGIMKEPKVQVIQYQELANAILKDHMAMVVIMTLAKPVLKDRLIKKYQIKDPAEPMRTISNLKRFGVLQGELEISLTSLGQTILLELDILTKEVKAKAEAKQREEQQSSPQ